MHLDWMRNCLKVIQLEVDIGYHGLGPLHTQPKSRNHKIVSPTKVSKGRPKTLPKSCSVVRCPQVQCEIIRD